MQRIQIEDRTDLKSEIPLSTPYCIFIDPSSVCNLRCSFCMNKNIKRPTTMRLDIFRKIIDDLEEFDRPVKTIRLYALGEPLMNKGFCSMVEYAKNSRKVIRVDTTTNGTILNPELNKQLADSGISRINISIGAMNTEKYREFTGNRTVVFEHIVEGVADLYSRLKGRGTIIFVKTNGDYLTDEEKETFFNIFKPICDGCALEHTMNCWKDFEVEDVNREVGLYGNPRKEVMVCPYVFYSFMIHADGIASACFLDWNRKLVIGDATIESMKSLWNDRVFNHLRMQMLHKERKRHPICRSCDQLIAGMPVDLDDHTHDILAGMKERRNA